MEKRFCRRCLIPDFVEDKEGFLRQNLGRIAPEDRTEAAQYDRRLEQCARCPDHVNGMCRLCGCFVAVRAAVARQYCPGTPDRWKDPGIPFRYKSIHADISACRTPLNCRAWIETNTEK